MEGSQPLCQPGPKHIHNIVLQALASSAGQNSAASGRAHLAQTQQTSLLLTGEVMLQDSRPLVYMIIQDIGIDCLILCRPL